MKRVLAALPPFAIPTFERVLAGSVDVLRVHSLYGAKALLQSDPDISLVVCGMHFDESRMFDLLRYAREAYPDMPFVCCRILEMQLPRISIEAAAISAVSLGAAAFFDFPTRAREVGRDAADEEFRNVLVRHLPDARAGN